MLRISLCQLLFSKPIVQGYVGQFPQPRVAAPKRLVRRAREANEDVDAQFDISPEKYEEWFKATYNVDDISTNCASVGPSAKNLDDSENVRHLVEDYDHALMEEELVHWNRTFSKGENLK